MVEWKRGNRYKIAFPRLDSELCASPMPALGVVPVHVCEQKQGRGTW